MKSRVMSGKAILLAFFLCALVDFVVGYLNGRLIGYGIGRAVVGLGGTAFLLWLFGLFDNQRYKRQVDATDDPNEPARWVP